MTTANDHHEHHRDPHHETPPMHDPVDPWHDHSHDPRPQRAHGGTLNARAVILIGIGLFLAVMVSTGIVYQYYVWYTTRMLDERASLGVRMSYKERMETKSKTVAQIAAEKPEWRDHDTVVVPFSRAVDEVVSRYEGGER